MNFRVFFSGLVLLFVSARAGGADFGVERAFPNLEFEDPLFLASPPDGSHRIFILQQGGQVLWFENDPEIKRAREALDISGKIRRFHGEEGLLGLAFHPGFAKNGHLFLYYSAGRRRKARRIVVSRWTMDAAKKIILPGSEKVFLEVAQPYGNHNGGMIAFGPDGFLYVGLGDGGWAGDPKGHGQNLGTLLGSMLRLNVDVPGKKNPYSIPKDNPFVGRPGARPEIWAYGLRNPWRFSFDRKTGTLWAGDVGQDLWEEIDIIKKGFNYGWKAREGAHDFDREAGRGPFEDPIVEHERSVAQSITGGYVYRGKLLPKLRGDYVYGDFVTGHIWRLRKGQGPPIAMARGRLISSFGEDPDGEILFTSFDGGIYRFVSQASRR